MRHVPTGRTQQMVSWPSQHPSLQDPGFGADDLLGDQSACSSVDLQSRYLVVKSVSSSPLRDDLDFCLAELDALIAIGGVESAAVITYLHFEMEERRIMITDALQSGYEV